MRYFDGASLEAFLSLNEDRVLHTVEETYLAHSRGQTINPPSLFLTVPSTPPARIIALPAYVGEYCPKVGLKWVSSFPSNIGAGLPRAHAVIILNSPVTGAPQWVLDGTAISIARTAASAALFTFLTWRGGDDPVIAVIGAGPVAEVTVKYLTGRFSGTTLIRVFDINGRRADEWADRVRVDGATPVVSPNLDEAIRGADIVIFATTAAVPYVDTNDLFHPGQIILHLSLRDIGIQTIVSALNFVDDPEHASRENTSLALAQAAYPGVAVINGTLGELLLGRDLPHASAPFIFSPFGLGILDISVAAMVVETLLESGRVPRELIGFSSDEGPQ